MNTIRTALASLLIRLAVWSAPVGYTAPVALRRAIGGGGGPVEPA